MKKKLLIFFIFLFINVIAHTQNAHYELNVNGRVEFTGSGCGGDIKGGLQWIAGGYENGTYVTLVQGSAAYPNNGVGLSRSNFNHTINFTESNKVTKLKLRTTRRGTTWVGSCRSSDHTNKDITISTCLNQSYTFSSLSLNQPGSFTTKVTPKITLTQPSNPNIGSDDIINIAPITGISNSFYNWEYSFNGTSWVDFPPSFQNNNFVNSKASEIIAQSTGNNHGKDLYVRVNTNCNNSISNVIVYNYKISAPYISSINADPVQCFEDENGSIKVNFDRSLTSGELLSISMTNTTTGIDYSEENITALEADNSYVIESLPPGSYTVRLLGAAPGYNGSMFNTYTDGTSHSSSFTITEPTPVEFSYTKVNVWCNGGSDGVITITANGGQLFQPYEYLLREVGETSENWVSFTSTATFPNSEVAETITGLLPKDYELKVRDSNGCVASIIQRDGNGQIVGLGAEVTETIEITQPDAPVAIDFVFSKEPTAFGFSDGRIRAQITGGTPLADGTYNYTWTHSNGTVWTTFTDQVTADGWFLTLENAIVGTYKLTVTDTNYTNTTDNAGCTIVEATFTLEEPPLLELSLAETNVISCHNTNPFGDPSSDGQLTATATGGVPFDPLVNGLAYTYEWKRKDAAGVYQVITGEASNVLSNINAGDYAVNIVDANGITVGTASNNVVTPVDVTATINQPDLLEIGLTKVDVFCKGGNDGSIDATITGGTGAYTINWNTGTTTEDLDTLIAGTYTIKVTDAKGCQAEATIIIDEPDTPLEINYTFFAPTFTGATNGWIEATVTGGTTLDTGKYTYNWKDANGVSLNAQVTETINATSFVIKLNDLGAGIYNLTIEDKNHPLAINATNCTIINSEYELFEPLPLSAEIKLHTPISCNSTNVYGDPSNDGALEVFAEGGVKLQASDNNGLDYYYTWKKETSPGVWTVLTTQTTNIAADLDAGNYAVNVEDANGIILGIYVDNVLDTATDETFLFEEPPLLELTIEKQDVYCFNGSDSWAKAIITGGVAPYDILWSNGDETVQTSSLSQGVYTVEITDSRGCQVSGSIQINQPTEAISIEYTAFATPSTGDASDGWIEAQIKGGTDFADGSYTYYWQDETGSDLNTQTTTSIVGGVFQIRLNTIPKGKYYLTIEDANFPLATTGDGCTVIDEEFILYDPIEAIISLHTPISCHQDNVFNNPFSDGKLQVSVTGGLPFDTGNPYIYYWKKENTSGSFDDLNQNSEIATGLSHGNYALNVEDSRGLVIGVYESLNLTNATDETFDFIEPVLLEVSLTKTAISCGAGNDATATVTINGGISPYIIQWSNGQETTTATNLIAGNYLVYITDARGCQATGNISIDQPGGLQINILEETNPTCFEGSDGKIELELSGGTPPYTYSWNTGSTNTSINNLLQGTYTFSLRDFNGCTAFKEIVLEHPDEIIINLGADRTLCKDQTQDLDASITDVNASYVWTSDNGFSATTSQITVSEAGTYQVTATSSLGCVATDTIVISYNDTEIDSEFLLSSQAYQNQDVILFNVSSPIGKTSEWVLPTDVTIISETATSITLRFPEVNTYKIGLISTQGDCYKEIYKNIVVEESSGLAGPGDSETPFIEEFTITPNPNNGQFELYINLAEASPIAIRVFSIQGSVVLNKTDAPTAAEYTIPISLTLPSGVYVVVLETAKQTQIKRMLVN